MATQSAGGPGWGMIYRLEGESLHVAAFYLASPEFTARRIPRGQGPR